MSRKCGYIGRPSNVFPCSDCDYKGKCETSGGKEPLTCMHCRFYLGDNKQVCYKRKGHNLRICKDFQWD